MTKKSTTTLHAIQLAAWFALAVGVVSASAQGVAVKAPLTSQAVLAEAPGGWLVTGAEAQTFQGQAGYDEAPALRPRALVPVIDILKPEPAPDLKVKAPFAIAVEFKGLSDADIDPATFKVLYGALKVDITGRITKYVTVSKEGFTLENAKIPVGKHRLTLQVQDTKQRVAERELRFEVE
jgi:hypothetical protein